MNNQIKFFIAFALIFFPLDLFCQEKPYIDDSVIINKAKYRFVSEDSGYIYLSRDVPVGTLDNHNVDWEQFLDYAHTGNIRLWPIYSCKIRRRAQKCFIKKEIEPLLNDSFSIRLYPVGTVDKKILGFWQIKIVSDTVIPPEEILKMKSLSRVMKYLEKDLLVDSKGIMEKFNFDCIYGTGAIDLLIKEDGWIEVTFADS